MDLIDKNVLTTDVAGAVEERVAKRGAKLRSVAKTPKSQATRKRIMDEASRLMSERGSTDFQMAEVSSRCGMSKGSLYYYFSDREALVDAIFQQSSDDLVEALDAAVKGAATASEGLEALVAELAKRLCDGGILSVWLRQELVNPTRATMDLADNGYRHVVHVVEELVDRAKDEGYVRQDVDSYVAASFVTGGVMGGAVALEEQGAFATGQGEAQLGELMGLSLRGILAS